MWKRLLIPVLALLLPWVLLEGALRVGGFRWVSETAFSEDRLEPFWTDRGEDWEMAHPVGLFTQKVSKAKAPGEIRVVFIGGSSMFLMAYFKKFAEVLERKFPGRKIQPINMGVPMWGSYRERLLAAQALTLQPDLLVMYSGHNEFYENFMNRKNSGFWLQARAHVLSISRGAQVISWAADRAASALMERGMRRLYEGHSRISWNLNFGTGEGFVISKRDEWLEFFQQNLEAIAKMYRAAAVPVLLVTTGFNREIKPLFGRHSPDHAIAFWKNGLRLKREGRQREAREALEMAGEWDLRKSSPATNLRVKWAAERSGAHFYDFDSDLVMATNGIPGDDHFFDQCHLRSPKWTDFLQEKLAERAGVILLGK